jgi:hypothetical protein
MAWWGNSGILCPSLKGFAPVGAQESIFSKHRLKGGPEMLRINSIKNRIKGLTIAIPNNQNGNLLIGKPWFCRFSSPFPSWPRQFPLTFEGLQKKVSSASAIPDNSNALSAEKAFRNRCLHGMPWSDQLRNVQPPSQSLLPRSKPRRTPAISPFS